ncbi:hypothetical protein [Aporhodopirellula aestuarii]|uniref:Uncharacterized protein n=1 Tax=Aporhodopirellula aestuarii TaxID=2950107 RepID=A0ABT0U4E2_9BACT|nr:hypothetical protein [Aporhodopirellula aestuarii]MCM2371763.1 hypothetical protein [Aporhodopirellula aestuarii]
MRQLFRLGDDCRKFQSQPVCSLPIGRIGTIVTTQQVAASAPDASRPSRNAATRERSQTRVRGKGNPQQRQVPKGRHNGPMTHVMPSALGVFGLSYPMDWRPWLAHAVPSALGEATSWPMHMPIRFRNASRHSRNAATRVSPGRESGEGVAGPHK